MRRFYDHDLRELLTVTPHECLRRILNSFIPTRHASILGAPDIFGPLIAVFGLPQVLLLSMGVSRHGCSPSALLGNAVAVSLCLWLGLSFMYRWVMHSILMTVSMYSSYDSVEFWRSWCRLRLACGTVYVLRATRSSAGSSRYSAVIH
jgi:hypothetical protein